MNLLVSSVACLVTQYIHSHKYIHTNSSTHSDIRFFQLEAPEQEAKCSIIMGS